MAHDGHRPLDWIDEQLAALEREGLRRTLRVRRGPQSEHVTLDDQPLVNFGSNDYLGLASDPRLADAAN